MAGPFDPWRNNYDIPGPQDPRRRDEIRPSVAPRWEELLPGSTVTAINQNPVAQALGRFLSKPSTGIGEVTRVSRIDGRPVPPEPTALDNLPPTVQEGIGGLGLLANFLAPGAKTSVKAFHGTNRSFDRAQMGANPAGASGSREGPLGFWMTDNPNTAGNFAEWSARGGDGARVIPLRAEFSNPLEVESYSQIKDLIDAHTKFQRPGYQMQGRNIRMTDDSVDYEAARRALIEKGHDGIVLRNTMTDSPDGVTPINQYVAIKPGTVRNAFTGDLVYGSPFLGAGALGAFLMEQQEPPL